MKRFALSIVLAGSLLTLCAPTSWAVSTGTTNVDIGIQQGVSQDGFVYSVIHGMRGTSFYESLSGALTGEIRTLSNGMVLDNISGTLTAESGTLHIANGWLASIDYIRDGAAYGYLPYTFASGKSIIDVGAFRFRPRDYGYDMAPFGGPNALTAEGFTVWGQNFSYNDPYNECDLYLGIDLVGDITPQTTATPEPTSMALLGSGIAGLIYWRRKQQAAA